MRDDTVHEQNDSRFYGRNNPSLGSQVDHVFNVIGLFLRHLSQSGASEMKEIAPITL